MDPEFLQSAKEVFDDTGVNVVTSRRFLGGVIGDQDGKNAFIKQSVNGWISQVNKLIKIAETQPQCAYVAFTKALQFKWSYIQRVTSAFCSSLFDELEAVIKDHFLPTVLGFEVSNVDRKLYPLPARYGGLGVCNPTATAELFYSRSRKATDVMVQCIKTGEIVFEVDFHNSWCAQVHDEHLQQNKALHLNMFEILLQQYDTIHQRAILRAKSEKVSGWLTALPLKKCQFDLSSQEFLGCHGHQI